MSLLFRAAHHASRTIHPLINRTAITAHPFCATPGQLRRCSARADLQPAAAAASHFARPQAQLQSTRGFLGSVSARDGPRSLQMEGSHVVPGPAASSGAAEPLINAEETPAYSGLPKLLVFGGNGFVGTRVCEEALNTGLAVVSVNRSGPPKSAPAWAAQVQWVQADVFDIAGWRDQLEGTIGVISCLGAFGSNEFMYKMCGESNATIFREAAAAGVERATFVSVHDYGFPDFVLSGYFKGKRHAEGVLATTFPNNGVSIRPSFIHGTRQVGPVGIPLSAVGWPLEKALAFVPTQNLAGVPLIGAAFVPPVSAKAVAKAAVAAATDDSVPPGIMDVWAIHKFDQ